MRIRRAALVGVMGASLVLAACGSSTSSNSGSTATSRAGAGPTATSGTQTTAPAASASLTSALQSALTTEHDAKATYDNVIARLGQIQPFTNVAASEAQHVSTLESLATRHGVALPAGPFPGQPAPATRTAACQLGVTIEQHVVGLYTGLLTTVTAYPDVTQAFDTLRSASQDNHLPAFQHCA